MMTTTTLVTRIMTPEVFTLKAYDTFKKAEELFNDKSIHQLPVLDENRRIIGMVKISDYHLLCDRYGLFNEALGKCGDSSYFENLLVRDVMHGVKNCLSEYDNLKVVLEVFKNNPYESVPVVNAGEELIGIVSISDIVQGIGAQLDQSSLFEITAN